MKKLYLLIVVFCCTASLQAQDILTSKLEWNVNQLQDLNTGKSSSYNAKFKTNGSGDITWEQSAENYNLTVVNVNGNWMDIKSSGQMIFSISIDGETGTLAFEKKATGIFITLDLSQAVGRRLNHRYSVSQIDTLN